MRKISLFIFFFLILCTPVNFAQNQTEGLDVFNMYQTYANNYDRRLLDLYSPDVKIIREVIKPDGNKVRINIPAKRFFHELKIGQKTAKLRRYKNKYKNITTEKLPNGIKVSAVRQPTNESYWLNMYQILQPTVNGYKIVEEMMETKVQTFLNAK